jgi:toxin-antitoxin system PIN domain toxin
LAVRLLDVNLLVYATFSAMPRHAAARRWLDGLLRGREQVAFPWETLCGFVRLASNPRVFSPCLPVAEAWRHAAAWLDCPCAWIPAATPRHRDILSGLLSLPGLTHKLVADAHLAALALEHGLVLCSADEDFRLFPGLRFENPLA